MGTMNKEMQVVVKGVTLNVMVTDDFTVKGSFDPNAACPEEYFGYRETELEVLSGLATDGYPMDINDIDEFMDDFCLDVEAAIQEQLDGEKSSQLYFEYEHFYK